MHRFVRSCARRTSLALGLLLFASWLAAGAHWITTPHRVCGVHGTIEHARGVEAPRTSERHAPATPIYDVGEGVHEECALGPYARTEAFPLPAGPPALGLAPAPSRAATPVRDDPLPELALFLLAPSRSPPGIS